MVPVCICLCASMMAMEARCMSPSKAAEAVWCCIREALMFDDVFMLKEVAEECDLGRFNSYVQLLAAVQLVRLRNSTWETEFFRNTFERVFLGMRQAQGEC